MEVTNEFILQTLGAVMVELAALRVKYVQLERELAALKQAQTLPQAPEVETHG